jgi:hypothetical protein
MSQRDFLIQELVESDNIIYKIKEKIFMLMNDYSEYKLNNELYNNNYKKYIIKLKNEEIRYYRILEDLRDCYENNEK